MALTDIDAFFLSHAGEDKDFVKLVATRIAMAGRTSFLDEWSIEFGESIPGAIATALRDYEAVVLFWSVAAEESAWVKREFQSAVSRFIDSPGRVLLVVRLDDTDVPELIRDLKWIDGRDEDVDRVANSIMGLNTRDQLIAMQKHLETMNLRFEYFHGYGPAVACVRCGAGVEDLRGWHQWDDERDDEYAGVQCTKCGWTEGGEI